METFLSLFLEKTEMLNLTESQWTWKPAGKYTIYNLTYGVTQCGMTREYGGGTDRQADDETTDE